MGADPSIAAKLFCYLATDFNTQTYEVQVDRKRIAKLMYKLFEEVDFNDDDLDCYEELFILGLAKRCPRCEWAYTEWSSNMHGENSEYGDCYEEMREYLDNNCE